jgi:hypothetical protein
VALICRTAPSARATSTEPLLAELLLVHSFPGNDDPRGNAYLGLERTSRILGSAKVGT